jgi:hypothetical protein
VLFAQEIGVTFFGRQNSSYPFSFFSFSIYFFFREKKKKEEKRIGGWRGEARECFYGGNFGKLLLSTIRSDL